MSIRELSGIEIKEALIWKNIEGVDVILARLGLRAKEDEPPLGMDAVVQWEVRYYVPSTDGSSLNGMLGEGYEALPTNLSELPEWREYVREEARKDVEKLYIGEPIIGGPHNPAP